MEEIKKGDKVRIKYSRDLYAFYEDSFNVVSGEVIYLTEKFTRLIDRHWTGTKEYFIRRDKILSQEVLRDD